LAHELECTLVGKRSLPASGQGAQSVLNQGQLSEASRVSRRAFLGF
jgi:hypothetical protein